MDHDINEVNYILVYTLLFVDLFAGRGGGSTTAAVTLDTVADESRKITDGVARSPTRLCSRDGKICCYGDALRMIFVLARFCTLRPFFRFSFLSPCYPPSRYVYVLRVPLSVKQRSATLST